MKKPTLYLETSVVSYLTARPSRDLNTAAHQQITAEWWENKRKSFDVWISNLVWWEASDGDVGAVQQRLKLLKPFPRLPINRDASVLARDLIAQHSLPRSATDDALHIALAAVHGILFLLTWNCTHINNVATIESVRAVCQQHGFTCPVICTPDELIRI